MATLALSTPGGAATLRPCARRSAADTAGAAAEAGLDAEAEIRTLLERPIEGAVRLALPRSPSPRLASEVEGDCYQVAATHDPHSGALLGMGVRTVRNVYFDGRTARVGYLSQLRVTGKVGFGRWRAGFRELLAAREPDQLGFHLTTIAADNRAARRLLERGLPGLPAYQEVGGIETLVFATFRRGRDLARPATGDDLPAISARLEADRWRYTLAPRWSREDLEPGGRCRGLGAEDFLIVPGSDQLRGCVAIWDQRAFKQVVVAGYAPWLARLRPLVNAVLRLRGAPRLPRPGSTLGLAYLSHFSADDAEAATVLLESACRLARRRGLEQLVLSLSTRHPLLAAIERRRAARRYRTTLYALGATAPELEGLRRGVVHLEGATL